MIGADAKCAYEREEEFEEKQKSEFVETVVPKSKNLDVLHHENKEFAQ